MIRLRNIIPVLLDFQRKTKRSSNNQSNSPSAMPYVTTRYERAKLYEEVSAEAVTRVTKRYCISDVALRKICKRLAVPLPPLGHWAKTAAGKRSPVPPLPSSSGPAVLIRQRYVNDDADEPAPGHLIARRAFEAGPDNRISNSGF